MNLRPPPTTDDIEDLRKWCEDLYEFLKFPHFHGINLVPRASMADTTEGNVYYDSDTDKLTLRVADAWETVKRIGVWVDADAADQGATNNTNSIKYILNLYGTSERINLYFEHRQGDANQTEYKVDTSIDFSSYPNVYFYFMPGAYVDGVTGDETFKPYSPENIDAGDHQQIFGSSLTVRYTIAGRISDMWYGVTSDGSTDDAAASQAAADSLQAGGTYYMPKGSSYRSWSVTVDFDQSANVTVEAENGAEVRMSAASQSGINNTQDYFKVLGLTMEGEGTYVTTGSAGKSLIVTSGKYTIIQNCYLKEPEQQAVKISDDYATIENNIFEGGKYFADNAAIGSDRQHYHIVVDNGADHPKILNNIFQPNNDANPGMAISPIVLSGTVMNAEIRGNRISDAWDHGIYAYTEGGVISNNILTGCGMKVQMRADGTATDGNTIVGNNIDVNDLTGPLYGDHGMTLTSPFWTTVKGNTIRRASNYGISMVSSDPYRIKYNNIIGNIIDDVQDTSGNSEAIGIAVSDSNCIEFSHNVIANNIIRNVTSSTGNPESGIYIQPSNTASHLANIIEGNVIDTIADDGMLLYYLTGATIRGNSFRNIGTSTDSGLAGMNIVDLQRSLVEGNYFYGDGANFDYGYREDSSSDYNIVRGNVFYNIDTEPVRTLAGGANTIIEDNYLADGSKHVISETVTGSPTLNQYPISYIDSSGGAVTATLGDGSYVGQRKTIGMSDATNSSTVSVTSHETSDPEVFTFAQTTDILVLEWNGNEWTTISNVGVAT